MTRIRNWLFWHANIGYALLMFFMFLVILSLTGCGHNMLVENKAVGAIFRIPAGEVNYFGFGIGSMESVVAAVRGGASFESTTSAGGSVLSTSGAINKITTFRSNLQFNEGNLEKAFANPDIPMEVKLRLADGVFDAAKAPKFPDAIITSRDSVLQMGAEAVGSNATSVASLKQTGIDNLVDKTPAIIDSAVAPVADTVHELVNPLEGTVSSVTNVVNSVNATIEEVDHTINEVGETVDDTVSHLQKTLTVLIAAIVVGFCIIIVVITISSIVHSRKIHKPAKKIHIGEHLDDEVLPVGEGQPQSEGETPLMVDTEISGGEQEEPLEEQPPVKKIEKLKNWLIKFFASIAAGLFKLPMPLLSKGAKFMGKFKHPRKNKK